MRWAGQSAIITLPAGIDLNNADQVSDELLRILEQGPQVLVVDVTGTTFCASDGVHAVLRAHQRAAAIPVVLRLAAGGYAVRRVLELTGANHVIDTYPSLDTALAAMRARCDGTGATAAETALARARRRSWPRGEPCPGSAVG